MNKGIVILANIENGEIKQKLVEFDEETDITLILYYTIYNFAFRIISEKDRTLWANIIDTKWEELDEHYYYNYNKPFCYGSDWMCESNGRFLSLDEALSETMNTINKLTELKKNTN